jgi:hypothetical protein
MKRLLRTLFTVRGLILAGTLMLAVAGSYLDRETAPSVTEVNSHLAAHVQALDGRQVQPLEQALAGHHFQPLSVYEACAQPGYGNMILCPLWH